MTARVYTYSGRFSFWEDPKGHEGKGCILIKDSLTGRFLPNSYSTCDEALAHMNGMMLMLHYGTEYLTEGNTQ